MQECNKIALFSSLGKLAGKTIYVLLALIFFLLFMISRKSYARMYQTDFRNLSKYESAFGADDQSDLFFRFLKGRCHGK